MIFHAFQLLQITILTSYPHGKDDPNIENIVNYDFTSDKFTQNVFTEKGLLPTIKAIRTTMPDICSRSLASEQSQKIFERKFDLVIISYFFSDCYYSLVNHLKVSLDCGFINKETTYFFLHIDVRRI